jgi:tRNA pseudouridine38-40 synthase
MPTFKITIAYDGTGFVGWQRQAVGESIQGLLEQALRELDGRPVNVHGAGRTDAGVHALGQVASFTLERAIPATVLRQAMNAHLPEAIRVLEAVETDARFHARFDARDKTYRYRIWNGDVLNPFERPYALYLPGALDVDAMNAAARTLEGVHDFAAFQAAGSATNDTRREVLRCEVTARPSSAAPWALASVARLVALDISGTGFLRHMVRAIAGSLVDIGRGRHDASWLGELLASRDRTLAGATVPAHGLFLVGVNYG